MHHVLVIACAYSPDISPALTKSHLQSLRTAYHEVRVTAVTAGYRKGS